MKNIFLLSVLLLLTFNVFATSSTNVSSQKDHQEIYWKAVRLYSEENYAQALLYFNHLLDMDPVNYELNYYTGMCYYNLNRMKLARFYFTQVMDDNVFKLKVMFLTHNDLE